MKMTMNMTKLAAAVCLSMSMGLGIVSAQDMSMPAGPMMSQGMPPQGMPPQGMPPQGQQGKSISEFTAAQRITGKQALLVNQDITATEADENAVLAEQGANVTLQKVRLSRRAIRPVMTAVISTVRMPSSSFPIVRLLLPMRP